MKDVFEFKESPYNLRSGSNHFMVSYQLSNLAPQILKLVPQSFRRFKALNEHKALENVRL